MFIKKLLELRIGAKTFCHRVQDDQPTLFQHLKPEAPIFNSVNLVYLSLPLRHAWQRSVFPKFPQSGCSSSCLLKSFAVFPSPFSQHHLPPHSPVHFPGCHLGQPGVGLEEGNNCWTVQNISSDNKKKQTITTSLAVENVWLSIIMAVCWEKNIHPHFNSSVFLVSVYLSEK